MVTNKKSQTRLITGIGIMIFGALAAMFLGAGIAINNSLLSWIGGILMAGIGFVLSIVSRFLE